MIAKIPKKNQLTNGNAYKLTRWVDEHKVELVRLTRAQIAVQASEALGFPVTEFNVCGAARNLGVPIGLQRQRPVSLLDRANAADVVLARSMLALYDRMGIEMPDDLLAIATA